jgi:hypothetical protein
MPLTTFTPTRSWILKLPLPQPQPLTSNATTTTTTRFKCHYSVLSSNATTILSEVRLSDALINSASAPLRKTCEERCQSVPNGQQSVEQYSTRWWFQITQFLSCSPCDKQVGCWLKLGTGTQCSMAQMINDKLHELPSTSTACRATRSLIIRIGSSRYIDISQSAPSPVTIPTHIGKSNIAPADEQHAETQSSLQFDTNFHQ